MVDLVEKERMEDRTSARASTCMGPVTGIIQYTKPHVITPDKINWSPGTHTQTTVKTRGSFAIFGLFNCL